MRRFTFVATVLMLSSAPVAAEELTTEEELRLLVGQQLQLGPVELTRKTLDDTYAYVNADGRGVSKAGYELAAKIAAAQMRSAVLTNYLRMDLDGDMQVTQAEVEASLGPQARRSLNSNGVAVEPTPEQVKTILDKLVAEAMQTDTDKNKVIDIAEMLAVANTPSVGQRAFQDQQLVPLGLDRNGDGVVSRQEFDEAVDPVLKSLDTNGDGHISQAERDTAMKDIFRLQQIRIEHQAAAMRRVPAGSP